MYSAIPRCLVGGVAGSRCRLNIAAFPVAGAMKLTAAAPYDVFVTRGATGGSGVFANKLTRWFWCDPKDVGAEEDSWESFQENLVNFPKWRSDQEIRIIYKRWCQRFDYDRKFGIFKQKMRLIDKYNSIKPDVKLGLDCSTETSFDETVKLRMRSGLPKPKKKKNKKNAQIKLG